MQKRIAIIGSGVSGLASAVRLAHAGFMVDVYEKGEQAGGKMNEFSSKGYRFDTGPSLFTLPHLVTELFTLCNENWEEHIQIQKPDVSCRYFYPDKTIINAWQKVEDFANELEAKTGEPAQNVLDFLARSKKMYDLTAPVFIFQSLAKTENVFSRATFEVAKQWQLLDPFKTMHRKNEQWFKSDKVIQLFNRYATYNGSNPYTAPATLNVIPHLEHNLGAFLPKGGIYSIACSLQKLAENQGANFFFNTRVKEIRTNGKRVLGICLEDGVQKDYDLVMSDVDMFTLYEKLLPSIKLPRLYRKREMSSSALIFYWGINGVHPKLDVHNILFSGNYVDEFQSIFKSKQLAEDPTVYIYISSKLNTDDAPVGCENWFVMMNAPHNVGQNWDDFVAQARVKIVDKINEALGIDVRLKIETERVLNPETIEKSTDSYRGALYGPSSNSKLAAFIRHPNFKRRLKNLYFAGGSVHPGGGIPLCLASAKIVSAEIINQNK